MKRFAMMLMIVFGGIFLAMTSVNAEMTPEQVLEQADLARGNVLGVEWKIHIVSIERGRQQDQTLKIKARGFNILAETLSPPKLKGRKILMIDRNMWFIKPGLRKPVPISPRQKLMGGASNGDLASTNYSGDYKVASVSHETLGDESCYLFDLMAANKKTTYDRIRYWISEKRLVGVKAEFFTVSGKMFKTAVFEYDNRIHNGDASQVFISKMVITDAVMKKNITTMSYSDVKIKKIPEAAFNLNLLVR